MGISSDSGCGRTMVLGVSPGPVVTTASRGKHAYPISLLISSFFCSVFFHSTRTILLLFPPLSPLHIYHNGIHLPCTTKCGAVPCLSSCQPGPWGPRLTNGWPAPTWAELHQVCSFLRGPSSCFEDDGATTQELVHHLKQCVWIFCSILYLFVPRVQVWYQFLNHDWTENLINLYLFCVLILWFESLFHFPKFSLCILNHTGACAQCMRIRRLYLFIGLFWDNIFLWSPSWLQTCNLSASASLVLGPRVIWCHTQWY